MSTFRLSMIFMKTNKLSPSLQDVDEKKGTYSKTMQVAGYVGRERWEGLVSKKLAFTSQGMSTTRHPAFSTDWAEPQDVRRVGGMEVLVEGLYIVNAKTLHHQGRKCGEVHSRHLGIARPSVFRSINELPERPGGYSDALARQDRKRQLRAGGAPKIISERLDRSADRQGGYSL
jgi:hypothetical protein